MKTTLKTGVSSFGFLPHQVKVINPTFTRLGRSMGKTTAATAKALKQALR